MRSPKLSFYAAIRGVKKRFRIRTRTKILLHHPYWEESLKRDIICVAQGWEGNRFVVHYA